MISVIDASAAVEIALYRGQAKHFKSSLVKSEIVIAPDLFVPEITNSFWKYRRIMGMPDDKCAAGIQVCLDMVDDFIDTKSLWREVYSESVSSEHPAYDMFYLILARRNSAQIVTCDAGLKKLASEMRIPAL